MDRHLATKLLEALKADPAKVLMEKGWHNFHCPLAPFTHGKGTDSNPSMGMQVVKNKKSFFHCFSCDFSGDASDLVFTLAAYLKPYHHDADFKTANEVVDQELEGTALALANIGDYDEVDEEDQFMEFPEWWLATFPKVEVDPEAVKYLKGRGMTKELREQLDVRWDGINRRVCFPVRDIEGRLAGLHGRHIDKGIEPPYHVYKFMKSSNMDIWWGEDVIDWEKPVLIVESVFDRTQAMQVYPNTISPLRAGLSVKKLDRLANGFFFVHMLDGDKAGRNASAKIKKHYPKATHKIIDLPDDIDPGKMSLTDIQACLEKVLDLSMFTVD